MFVLFDCNNFYVACERLFNPKLKGPVVVLSNNDGCVIARSKEAKNLGIPMGAPIFQWRDFAKRNHVHLLSSNFSLYGDLSRRVMEVIQTFSPIIEIYSIDEAFAFFPKPPTEEELLHFKEIIAKWTGIDVSIGMAPTKTLAKAANYFAKKDPTLAGVMTLTDPQTIDLALKKLALEEVWGIGRASTKMLHQLSLFSAFDLKNASDAFIDSHFPVQMKRTALELRGISCLELEEVQETRKSILSSRSFSKELSTFNEIFEALSYHIATAAKKLREEELTTSHLLIFLVERERTNQTYPTKEKGISLSTPTDFTPLLLKKGKQLLQQIFSTNKSYRKVGVLFSNLTRKQLACEDFFQKRDMKEDRLMQTVDEINKRFGKRSVHFGTDTVNWQMKGEQRSPRYTTDWDELLTIIL